MCVKAYTIFIFKDCSLSFSAYHRWQNFLNLKDECQSPYIAESYRKYILSILLVSVILPAIVCWDQPDVILDSKRFSFFFFFLFFSSTYTQQRLFHKLILDQFSLNRKPWFSAMWMGPGKPYACISPLPLPPWLYRQPWCHHGLFKPGFIQLWLHSLCKIRTVIYIWLLNQGATSMSWSILDCQFLASHKLWFKERRIPNSTNRGD